MLTQAHFAPHCAPDEALLQALQGCLDEGTLLELRLKKSEDPALSYSKFWEHLNLVHGIDASFQNRKAWESVALDLENGELTKANFLKFRAQFILARISVLDRSNQEECSLLLAQLPKTWLDRVQTEEMYRKRHSKWLKATNFPPQISKREIKIMLQAGFEWKTWKSYKMGVSF